MTQQQVVLDHVVSIVANVLGLDAHRVLTDVHIQKLGFTSVELIKFVDHLAEVLDEDIHPGIFFEYTTLEMFTAYLMEHQADALSRTLLRATPPNTCTVSAVAFTEKGAACSDDDGWAAIEAAFLNESARSTDSAVPDSIDGIPVIIGGGIGGMVISRSLSQRGISHVLIGTPLLGDTPKLGESMTEAVTIEFTRNFKTYSQYFYRKEITPFFMGDMVSGLRFNFFSTFASLFLEEDPPNVYIHVDRIGFDQALYEEVAATKTCNWIEEQVVDVDYCRRTDRVNRVTLSNGQVLSPSYVWDCTNHIRLLGRRLGIPYKDLDGPRRVFFTHYFQKDGQPTCDVKDAPWMHGTSLLQAQAEHDRIKGVSWLIPLGRYVSVGISIAAEDVGDKTPEEIITYLTRAYQNRGLDYTRHFPRRKEIVDIPSQHFMYERFVGKNWALVGGSAANTWFTSASNISMIACMACMADKIIDEPQLYGEHYSRHVAGFAETQVVYDSLLRSDLGAVDAMKFLSGIVEQGRRRISSFFMFRDGVNSQVASTAHELWREQALVDKKYLEFLRQIATHASPKDRRDQTAAIFQKFSEMEQRNQRVTIPYLKQSEIRKRKPELFV